MFHTITKIMQISEVKFSGGAISKSNSDSDSQGKNCLYDAKWCKPLYRGWRAEFLYSRITNNMNVFI